MKDSKGNEIQNGDKLIIKKRKGSKNPLYGLAYLYNNKLLMSIAGIEIARTYKVNPTPLDTELTQAVIEKYDINVISKGYTNVKG